MSDMRKLDLLHIAASKTAVVKLHSFLKHLREDVADAVGGTTTIFHKGSISGSVILLADATDLPTVIALANEMKAAIVAHLASTGFQGVHASASAEAIAAADADDQTTANTLLNELKADHNTHCSESGVHLNNDGTNTVSSTDASDLASSLTLANEIKTDFGAHILGAMSAGFIADL